MLRRQYLASSLRPSHPSYHYVSQPSGSRAAQRIPTLQSRYFSSIQQYLTNNQTPPGEYQHIIQSIHTSAVESYLNQAPPKQSAGRGPAGDRPRGGAASSTLQDHLVAAPFRVLLATNGLQAPGGPVLLEHVPGVRTGSAHCAPPVWVRGAPYHTHSGGPVDPPRRGGRTHRGHGCLRGPATPGATGSPSAARQRRGP